MWQLDWAAKPPTEFTSPASKHVHSAISKREISSVHSLFWEEHCVECAVPTCYKVCPLYNRRQDGKCARFSYGIYPNSAFAGLFPFGATIHFRRWAKLEARFRTPALSARFMRLVMQSDRLLVRLVMTLGLLLRPIDPRMRISGLYKECRRRLMVLMYTMTRWWQPTSFDELLIEVWNHESSAKGIVIEVQDDFALKFRKVLHLNPGNNLLRIPFEELNVDLSAKREWIRVYPDGDQAISLTFTWLDLVRYADRKVQPRHEPPKCVVWDLDNTLWKGILGEDGHDGVEVREEIVALIKKLDAKGVLHSIASKNDHDRAWEKIKAIGLEEFFLFPSINWKPKSEGLRSIAQELNIGIDSLVFVDDSPFEREEVRAALPSVRVLTETEVTTMLPNWTRELPSTAEALNRRKLYLVEAKRKTASARFQGGYLAFLRSCRMELEVFHPKQSADLERCLELILRSNQLNLSGHRYSREEFFQILDDSLSKCFAMRARDRFGDYGIVGFARITIEGDQAELVDLVFSCRIAMKKLENAWFEWARAFLLASGCRVLTADYVPTSKNGVLLASLKEVGFGTGATKPRLPLSQPVPDSDIVAVLDQGVPHRARASGT